MGLTFVLIHGAWHDGSTWAGVRARLEFLGHEVHTPTLAGNGKDGDRTKTYDDAVQSVVDYIESNNVQNFVLVGHSYGGTIVSKVAELVSDRIRRLVYYSGFVLQDGECLNDNVPPHYVELFDALAESSGNNTVMLPYEVWREAFINDADEATAKATYALLSPQPYQVNKQKVDLKKFFTLQIPKSFLVCEEDNAIPQGPEWGWHPRLSSRLGMYRLVRMSGSHEVLFTNPSGLADKLIEAGRD